MSGYAFHPEAVTDLEEIWDYAAETNVDAADRLLMVILRSLELVAAFPHQGHVRPDLTLRPVRFIVVQQYLVAYAPDEEPVWVLAIIHGRRSPRVMAAILRGRE